jgi:hypothetical protein
MTKRMNPEQRRLEESRDRTAPWKRWGPYLSERAWGTVREDYSPDGRAWAYFPHDHARSRAYRWNEDGLAGICDRHQRICFALALWNGRDPILKERAFGLSGPEGNHGEDVKEYYFYLDNTPTHSYMKCLYKYPQQAFPYADLVDGNRRRDRSDPEYELLDTGVFDGDRYFDVFVEYAKAAPDDLLCRITVVNRGSDRAPLHILPTLWFRNTWSWGRTPDAPKPQLRRGSPAGGAAVVHVGIDDPGPRTLFADGLPDLLFAENETNARRLFDTDGPRYPKDAFHDFIVNGQADAVNPAGVGTKAAAHYHLDLDPGASAVLRLRLTDGVPDAGVGSDFDRVFAARLADADAFYDSIRPSGLDLEAAAVMRQACAGLLWSRQFYHYVVREWLDGDPATPPPPASRLTGRNADWPELYNADVLSMPDKWEYPWYAAWDLGFQCVALAMVDADFAKQQLVLLLREWYMHPNGQLPAYEWALGDVNPPVHAWAAWRVYQIDRRRRGTADRAFLERVFHKLLLNFTWWVNRKDAEGNNVFEGGFLGLDNIGVFDRSAPLPDGGEIEQSDGTSWMGMFTLNMLAIAMELAREDPVYEDMATKFWEHFLYIAGAMTSIGPGGAGMWDEQDGFFYDVMLDPGGKKTALKVRSMVGLIPLFAVETIEPELLARLPAFRARLEWFLAHRPDLTRNVASMRTRGAGERLLMSIVNREQLVRVLRVMLDQAEFLSPHGIRALSRYHLEHPYILRTNGVEHRVAYEPAESSTPMFGGNSNWRGPVWFPVNFLIVEALQRFHHYYGDDLTVEMPAGSGRFLTLSAVAHELSRRLSGLFLRGPDGRRPSAGGVERLQRDPHWKDYILFNEYFHGDNGAGLGASHQTGWTALVATLLEQSGSRHRGAGARTMPKPGPPPGSAPDSGSG